MHLPIDVKATYEGIRYGSTIAVRMLLAIAATLYAVFTTAAHVIPSADTTYVLVSGLRHWWALAFAIDAVFLWWRLFDPHARPAVAAVINISTFGLWAGVTGGTILTAPHVDPDFVGYIITCIMALHAVVRTDLTPRDRETA